METAVIHASRSVENPGSTHSSKIDLVVLSVSAGSEMFAIDVQSVREIHAWVPPVFLPGAPPYVQGMLNVEGEVVPLVILASRLGLPDTKALTPVTVMIEREDDIIGLVVDAVCDLHSISADQLCVTPAAGNDESARLLRGVITLDHALMCLIDVESMLPGTAIFPGAVSEMPAGFPAPRADIALDGEKGAGRE